MLLIRFTTITYWFRPKPDETIVQLSMRPVELGIRSVPKAERCKPHLLKTSWAKSCAAQGFPEGLAVGWQLTLAGG
jgi:hypothetical protein